MRRLKILAGLSTAALGAAALSGCGGGEGEGEGAKGAHDASTHAAAEGEGEGAAPAPGGESEGAAFADAASDRVAYFASLMMIEGHLIAGAELFAAGDAQTAAAHMGHPQAELYTSLKPAFDVYGASGFETELMTLATAVAEGKPEEEVRSALDAARAAVRKAAAAAQPTVKETMLAAAETLRAAGKEFDVGVKNGAIVNLHEYQDAHGFIVTVADHLATVEAADGPADAALGLAREQAGKALTAAPGVVAPEKVETSSATIFGAAARIEIAALGLQ